jgi:hypothetical protein
MRRAFLGVVLAAAAPAALAQNNPYAQQKSFRFTGDALARYEWTRDIPLPPGTLNPDGTVNESSTVNEDRYLLQARPRLEAVVGPLELGVGGLFNYSNEENDKAPPGETLAIVRDNYHSRDARLDLYWATVNAGPVVASGGRFIMPLPLTEMIWDKDLRPLGGNLTLQLDQGTARFAVSGIYATQSQVFEDKSKMYGGSAILAFQSGQGGHLELSGSYLEFKDLDTLDPVLNRQNAVLEGHYLDEYKIIDVQARLTSNGQLPIQLVADYCWNRALSEGNKGLWIAAVLGEVGVSRAQLSYTYAKIDANAVVAAFNTDDFFWGTGWEGHRVDLGSASGRGTSLHAIAQWQRRQGLAGTDAKSDWVSRYRTELRYEF